MKNKKRGQNRKGAIELSFGWLFAIIAGAVIIFFAVYFSTKLIGTEQTSISAQTGTQIGILLDPLETGFESAQTTSFVVPVDTRINNTCDAYSGSFGEQMIQLDQKNFGKWTATNTKVSFENKYIFSNPQIEGQTFYIFSKPFDFPFKVADLFYMTSENERYCFINAPEEVSTEITDLNESNLVTENCTPNDISVCFGNSNCDVNVDYNDGIVEKQGNMMYFSGTVENPRALMYAAIFSSPKVYECQVKRLMMREAELALLYKGKETNSPVACEKNLGDDLTQLNYAASTLNSSAELLAIKSQVDNIDSKNAGRICMLW